MASVSTNLVKTYAPDNRFQFTCPIFGSTTEIRVCLHLRDLLWAGKKQEVRRGCQACLHDSKCPIVPIVRDVQTKGVDPYYSAEPKHGLLKEEHLQRIRNIVVMDKTMDAFGVPDAERMLISKVSCFNAPLKGKADRDGRMVELEEVKVAPKPQKETSRATVAAPKGPTRAVDEAAIRGDMSAAITEAAKGAAA